MNILTILSYAFYILIAFVVFMIMVMIHELGHYTAGKIFKFKINEFSIGMGPKIFSKTRKDGEVFSLRALPLGGYCAFEGETEDQPDNSQSFNSQRPWKRLIVLFSGAFFNFISAIIFAIIAIGCFGDTVVQVANVYSYAPQANQELQNGDIFYQINGKKVYIAGDFQYYLPKNGEKFDVVVIRNGQQVLLQGLSIGNYVEHYVGAVSTEILVGEHKLVGGDKIVSINGENVIGDNKLSQILENIQTETVDIVVISSDGKEYSGQVQTDALRSNITTYTQQFSGIGINITYSKYFYSLGEVLLRAVPYCLEVAWLVLRTLGGLLTGVVGLDAVSGPISSIGITSQVVASGFGNIMALMAMVSVNLAVFNLLPVPALDGCQMIFVIIEWIARKPINRKVQSYINGIGFVLLIVLMLLIDILKL